jgi:hypothetical protein
MNRLVVATAVALAVGAGAGLVLLSAANPTLVVSCKADGCSVEVPAAVLDEVNRTMAKTVADTGGSDSMDEQALLKEVDRFFDGAASEHGVTEESDAVRARKFRKLFQ